MNPELPPDRLIDWTGERCVPWADDRQVIYEHLHRYIFAAGLASGLRVLDLGSGEGYGAAILAEVAESVTGLEIDGDAVEHASRRYRAPNLEFRCQSVLDLDAFADESFDVVVCFEMIEHIAEHDELVASARRLLRPEGLFLVSTPDREIYSEAADYHNPFHVKELSRTEFTELLTGYFGHVAMWTQSVVVGSIFRSVDESLEGLEHGDAVNVVDGTWKRDALPAPPYLLAVASATSLPALPAVSVLHHHGALQEPVPEASPSSVLENEPLYELWDVDRLRRQVAIYEFAIADEIAARRHAQVDLLVGHRREDALKLSVEELERSVQERIEEARQIQTKLDELQDSRAWRAVTSYRRLRERVPTGRRCSRNR